MLDLLKRADRPRLRLDSMIWSNSITTGSLGSLVSRSCMNSLKPTRRGLMKLSQATVYILLALSLLKHMHVFGILTGEAA